MAVLLAVLLAGAGQDPVPPRAPSSPAADAPSPRQDGPASPPMSPEDLPVSIEKIQRRLAQDPAIRVQQPAVVEEGSGLPVFRVRVEADKITIADLLGPDFLRGPVSYGGMTHQEFLDMVTPRDLQGYAAFSNRQAVTVAATSFALQWAVQTALRRYQEARNERAREAARKEVREALEALRSARLAAGLPDR